jgi:hypothetical protein
MTAKQGSNDTRHKDIQHKDTHRNNIQHTDIQRTETQHNDTQFYVNQLFNTLKTINITSPSITTLTTMRVLQFAHYP